MDRRSKKWFMVDFAVPFDTNVVKTVVVVVLLLTGLNVTNKKNFHYNQKESILIC